jgi:hypothetical protein
MFKDVIVPFFTKLIAAAATVLTVAAVLAMFVPVANAGTVYETVPVPNAYCQIKLRDELYINGNAVSGIYVESY